MLAHFLALFLGLIIPQPTDTPGGPIADVFNYSAPAVSASYEAPQPASDLHVA